MRVLLTGFEPFDGESVNPSARVVEALAAAPPRGFTLDTLILPVDRERAGPAVLAALHERSPDAVVMLGEAGGRTCVTPERVAVNVDDFRIPDQGGRQPVDEPVVRGGPAAYFATLPLRAMVDAMHAADLPAGISNSAGTYLCNHVFYRVMHDIATRGASMPAGFVHLPYLPRQARAKGDAVAGLPFAVLREAVTVVLRTLR